MKKNKIILFVSIIIGVVLLSGVAIFLVKKTTSSNKMTVEDIYSTNIIASVELLNNQMDTATQKLSTTNDNSMMLPLAYTSSLNYDELAELVSSMATIINDTKNNFVTEVSDKPEYETKIVYTGKALDGTNEVYTIYYSETPDTSFNDDKDETRTIITGIAIRGDKEYSVYGQKETERKESELELRIIFDQRNYVEISHELENRETEYEYEVVRNGRSVSEFSLELKESYGRTIVEIEKEFAGREQEIKLINYENSAKVKIELEEENINLVCELVTKEDGKNYYVFTNLKTQEKIEVLA